MYGWRTVFGIVHVIVASLCSKYFNKVSQNFIISKCYESTDENEKFVVIYNFHVFAIQSLFSFLLGLYYFELKNYFFDLSFTSLCYWFVVGLIINMRWMFEHFLKVEFDNFNLDKNFSYKLISIIFAHFLVNLLNVTQYVDSVEWISYFILLLCSLYINSLQYDMEIQNVDFEQLRPSIYSVSMKNNSIYIPTDN